MSALDSLRTSQASYQLKEQFLKAANQEKAIAQFKEKQQKLQLQRVVSAQGTDRQTLEQAVIEAFAQFHTHWNALSKQLKQQCKSQEAELRASHKQAILQQRQTLEDTYPIRYKQSSVLLDMIQIKEKANRTKQFIDAHRLKKEIAALKKQEIKLYLQQRANTISNQLVHFEKAKEQELVNLQAKHQQMKNELKKQRTLHYEVLVKKYENLHNELDLVQSIERNKAKGKHITGVGVPLTALLLPSPKKTKKSVK